MWYRFRMWTMTTIAHAGEEGNAVLRMCMEDSLEALGAWGQGPGAWLHSPGSC